MYFFQDNFLTMPFSFLNVFSFLKLCDLMSLIFLNVQLNRKTHTFVLDYSMKRFIRSCQIWSTES